MVTSLDEVSCLLPEATTSTTKLEWPQEIVSFFEVRPNSVNFMNEIFHANNTILPQSLVEKGGVELKVKQNTV